MRPRRHFWTSIGVRDELKECFPHLGRVTFRAFLATFENRLPPSRTQDALTTNRSVSRSFK